MKNNSKKSCKKVTYIRKKYYLCTIKQRKKRSKINSNNNKKNTTMKTTDNNQLELNFDIEINDFECSSDLKQQQAINERIADKREHNTTLSNIDFENYSYLHDTILNIIDDLATNEYTQQIIIDNIDNREQLFDTLHENYWTSDSVTGNGSGSYWFGFYPSSLAVFENIDVISDIYNEYGFDFGEDLENQAWEKIDVTARCYYLSEALNIVIDTFFEVNEIEA
jgi:hypothetical protein